MSYETRCFVAEHRYFTEKEDDECKSVVAEFHRLVQAGTLGRSHLRSIMPKLKDLISSVAAAAKEEK